MRCLLYCFVLISLMVSYRTSAFATSEIIIDSTATPTPSPSAIPTEEPTPEVKKWRVRIITHGGTVVTDGVTCKGTCRLRVSNGKELEFEAFEDSDTHFNGWKGSACKANGIHTTCTLMVLKNCVIRATFRENEL